MSSSFKTTESVIDKYYFEDNGGLFSKKSIIKLIVYTTRLEATGCAICQDKIQKERTTYYLEYEIINDVYEGVVDGKKGIIVEYTQNSFIVEERAQKIIILGIPDNEKWVRLIKQTKINLAEEKRKAEEEKEQKELQEKLQSEKRENDAIGFYRKCYEFHIQDDTPCYDLLRGRCVCALIYVGRDKSLNFLKIDGYGQEESNGTISYDKIHYYEKAGDIHYVTDIHGSYSSYGGSVTGGNFSKLAATGGGLLFGMLGMTAGALLTYKPAEIKGATTNFNIDSDAKKIDARSVILNFYSDEKKQYIDIELPADIYNFLQTYLPEKKYNIVLELEKKAALQQAAGKIEGREVLEISSSSNNAGPSSNTMDDFKQKVEKLKMMRDADLLTEEEFKEEKAKLLKMI